MRRMTKFAAVAAAAALSIGGFTACSNSDEGGGKGTVYYLNFKPESEAAWKEIASTYQKKTGVKVKIVTAASGKYEETLKSELGKSGGPTLFNLNGPVGLKIWQKYAANLTDTDFAKKLTDKSLALKGDDGKTYGVPFALEGYGIIYNKAIMDKYFALPDAKVKSVAEIKSFDKLKEAAEDIQAHKSELGIDGAFASTSFSPGEDWRWSTHLANYPVHYELKDRKVSDAKELKGTYFENFKNIFDLYLKNSTVKPSETSAKNVTDSMSEFALGKAAMVQNGNWAYSQISKVNGNTVKPDDVHFLPIYVGAKGEDKAGIAIGTENFLAVNAKASKASQKASIDFANWLFTSSEGAKLVSEKLAFIAPFEAFKSLAPADPLGKEVAETMNKKDVDPVKWDFTVFPSKEFKDGLGQHLAQYAAGKEKWSDVTDYFKNEWKTQKESSK